MGMAVDDAGREGEAVGLHGLFRRAEVGPDLDDLSLADGEVAPHRLGARAVEYLRVLDDKVKHLGFLHAGP